jgi:AraC family transcriptional regulator
LNIPDVSNTRIPAVAGSSAARSLALPSFRVSIADFSARTHLGRHCHPGATVGIMLRGSFETRIRERSHDCRPGVWWVEPPEEKHSNHISVEGASVLLIEPTRLDAFAVAEFAGFFQEQRLTRNANAFLAACRVEHELAHRDAFSALAVESAIISVLVPAARDVAAQTSRRIPRCVVHAREILHGRFRAAPALEEIAREVGVSSAYLARAFKASLGVGVATYARRLRLSWALDRIRNSTTTFSSIAFEAGYADQSHMTRDCTRNLGATPAQLRGSRA